MYLPTQSSIYHHVPIISTHLIIKLRYTRVSVSWFIAIADMELVRHYVPVLLEQFSVSAYFVRVTPRTGFLDSCCQGCIWSWVCSLALGICTFSPSVEHSKDGSEMILGRGSAPIPRFFKVLAHFYEVEAPHGPNFHNYFIIYQYYVAPFGMGCGPFWRSLRANWPHFPKS